MLWGGLWTRWLCLHHLLYSPFWSWSGPDGSGLAGSLGADARRCEGRLFLGLAPSPGLRSSDGEGWPRAQEERDSSNGDFRLQAAAGTFSPLSQPADVGPSLPTHTHTLMHARMHEHMHAYANALPSSSYPSIFWHCSVCSPGQSAGTKWAAGWTGPEEQEVYMATQERIPCPQLLSLDCCYSRLWGTEPLSTLTLLL